MAKRELKQATCITCKTKYSEKDEIEFIKMVGECRSCDHVRGEIYEEQLEEQQYEQQY